MCAERKEIGFTTSGIFDSPFLTIESHVCFAGCARSVTAMAVLFLVSPPYPLSNDTILLIDRLLFWCFDHFVGRVKTSSGPSSVPVPLTRLGPGTVLELMIYWFQFDPTLTIVWLNNWCRPSLFEYWKEIRMKGCWSIKGSVKCVWQTQWGVLASVVKANMRFRKISLA